MCITPFYKPSLYLLSVLQRLCDVERRFSENDTTSTTPRMPVQATPTMPRPVTPGSSPLFTPGDATLAAMREKVIGSSSCSNQRTFANSRQLSNTGAHLIFGKGSSRKVGGVLSGVHVDAANISQGCSSIGLDTFQRAPQPVESGAASDATTTDASIFNNLCEGS